VVICAKGILPYLKQEILDLGFPILGESTAGIETAGTFEDTLKLNLYLRTAQHVLFLLEHFKAANAEELYREISVIPWEEYLSVDQYLCITSSVDNPTIRDTRYANLKTKDAIVDRLRAKTGRRPDSGPQRTGAVVTLYWRGSSCRIYIDTSGEPLSHRDIGKSPPGPHAGDSGSRSPSCGRVERGWKPGKPHVRERNPGHRRSVDCRRSPPGFLRENFGFMHVRGLTARSGWIFFTRRKNKREEKNPEE